VVRAPQVKDQPCSRIPVVRYLIIIMAALWNRVWCGPSANSECRSGYIFATKACIHNRKKIVKQQHLLTCPHNKANFGPLAAEIGSGIWGTPANFNGFRVLAALLHAILVVGVSQTLRGGSHLYLPGRSSRWALAHILVLLLSSFFFLLFSSPNLSRRRLDVCHTLPHMVWP